MNFTCQPTPLSGLVQIENRVFRDNRGSFLETYNQKEFSRLGINTRFVQDNQSFSSKGVLRGLHFQVRHPQAKLVRVVSGVAFDVVVDLRKDSPTRDKWFGLTLTHETQLYIPPGFAHGFLALTDVIFAYKCSEYYHPEDESGIRWNDPTIGIEWPISTPLVSAKDQQLPWRE